MPAMSASVIVWCRQGGGHTVTYAADGVTRIVHVDGIERISEADLDVLRMSPRWVASERSGDVQVLERWSDGASADVLAEALRCRDSQALAHLRDLEHREGGRRPIVLAVIYKQLADLYAGQRRTWAARRARKHARRWRASIDRRPGETDAGLRARLLDALA